MSVDEMLNTALTAVGLPVFPNSYTGDEERYIVWSYAQIPAVHACDAPHAARYLITVHLYLPHKENPNALKQAISRALFNADCTWPSITNISDSEGQGYAIECEWSDGGGYYGDDNP